MKCVSLYSGADNLGDGIIQAGHEIILCVEKEKDRCETIHLNHPDIEVIHGLVSEHLESLPRCDAVVGGPPCPDFSRAKIGRTMDLCEVNNFVQARVITKAKHHFMENVQDLFKVHKKRNFLINTADYGVPQTRPRRIFTDLPLPTPTHSKNPTSTMFGEPMKKWVSIKDALGLDGIIQDRKTTFGEKYGKEDGKFREYSTDRPSHALLKDSRDWFVCPTGFDNKNKKQIGRSVNEPIMTIVNGNAYQFTDKPVSGVFKQCV